MGLPIELLPMIFSNLGIPGLGNAMIVCKTWKALAEDINLWKNRLPISFLLSRGDLRDKYGLQRYCFKPLKINQLRIKHTPLKIKGSSMLDFAPSEIKCTHVLVDLEPSMIRPGSLMIRQPEIFTGNAILKSRHVQIKG